MTPVRCILIEVPTFWQKWARRCARIVLVVYLLSIHAVVGLHVAWMIQQKKELTEMNKRIEAGDFVYKHKMKGKEK